MAQAYSNHRHLPTAALAAYVFAVGAAVSFGLAHFGWHTQMWTLAFLIATVMSLAYMSRVYITRLQDRIIKLEMRVRTAALLTPEQQRLMAQLSNKQIAALRFASDPELPALLERAGRERLEPDDIKRGIKTWVPDLDRT